MTFFDTWTDQHGKRLIVPEVVQTSAMDCGPATLKSLLAGYGIRVSYGRLREACQTSVDGTSIDVIQDIATTLGLHADQIILPLDHILLEADENLPGIIVTRQPGGATHFVVVWRKAGNLVQMMDPAVGRRWMPTRRFLDQVYIHTMPLPADVWRDWAESDGFRDPLNARLTAIEIPAAHQQYLFERALADETWYGLAALDACTRMVTELVQGRGVLPGEEASRIIRSLFDRALDDSTAIFDLVRPAYWFATPADSSQPAREQTMVRVSGAVLLRVPGIQQDSDPAHLQTDLPEELQIALNEQPESPEQIIWRYLRAEGNYLVPVVILAALLTTIGVIVEALLLRGVIDATQTLTSVSERAGLFTAILVFFLAMLLLQFPLNNMVARFARRFEMRLRLAFLEKIPKLSDRYFHSRLTSDMVQRAHSLRQLRALPVLLTDILKSSLRLTLTAIAVIWLEPGMILPVSLAVAIALLSMLISQPILTERNLRIQTHLGALSNFYLDAMLGLLPIRTHSAEPAVRQEHESRLVDLIHASDDFFNVTLLVQTIEALIGWFFATWILFHYAATGGSAGGALLLAYWALNIPLFAQQLADRLKQYPRYRNMLLRLVEPLTAPEETVIQPDRPENGSTDKIEPDSDDPAERELAEIALLEERSQLWQQPDDPAVSLIMRGVRVQAGGHRILSGINLIVRAGEHVAIVGPSGAGKSTLVGLLLGWHYPADGHVWIDGEPLRGARLQQLRRETAWVDPDVQLWNRTFLENLRYGTDNHHRPLNDVLERASLTDVLHRLDDGLQTQLGEGGGLVSGGEGQRVRLGRALMRPGTRLVIMDEPFRGLDRPHRRRLMQQVRQQWSDTTLLAITHDVTATQDFERVLVIEDGRIAEDGNPATLIAQPDSRYRALLDADHAINDGLWQRDFWRRLWLDDGILREQSNGSEDDA